MQRPSKRDRTQQKLLNAVRNEVETRLQQSLPNRLGTISNATDRFSDISLHWQLKLRFGSHPIKVSSDTTLVDIFDRNDICGRFAIVGRPGSGKTTELLKLAKKLIERAQANPNSAIPVLIGISVESVGRDQRIFMQEYTIEKINQKYGLRQDLCKLWLNAGLIVPLLESLKLPTLMVEQQEDFRKKGILQEVSQPLVWQSPIVACLTSRDYFGYQTLLNLNACVEIQPLSTKKIQVYLQKNGCQRLWDTIQNDESFMRTSPYNLGLARIPLFLNLAIATSHKINFRYWQQLASNTARIDYLLSLYIDRFLENNNRGNYKTSKAKTMYWLGWLADKLEKEGIMEFAIEDIQPSWLETYKQKVLYIFNIHFLGILLIFSPMYIIGFFMISDSDYRLFILVNGLFWFFFISNHVIYISNYICNVFNTNGKSRNNLCLSGNRISQFF